MKRPLILFIIFFIGALFLSDYAEAQRRKYRKRRKVNRAMSKWRGPGSRKFKPHFYAGVGLNTLNYLGDLGPIPSDVGNQFSQLQIGGSLMVGYYLSERLSVRGTAMIGSLEGDDANADSFVRNQRNLSFETPIAEASLVFTVDILPNPIFLGSETSLNPYLMGGFGGIFVNPKTEVPEVDRFGNPLNTSEEAIGPVASYIDGNMAELRAFGTEGNIDNRFNYGFVHGVFILGGGVRFDFSETISIGYEVGFRLSTTDNLDDVGGNYPDNLSNLANSANDFQRLTAALSDKSFLLNQDITNPDGSVRKSDQRVENDGYILTQLSVVYNFELDKYLRKLNPRMRRPKFR